MTADTFRKTWRPAMGWALVFINVLYALVICMLLMAGRLTFDAVLSFMLAQIGQLTVLGSITSIGRSREKLHGKDGEGGS